MHTRHKFIYTVELENKINLCMYLPHLFAESGLPLATTSHLLFTFISHFAAARGLSSILLPTWLSSIFRRFYIYIYFKYPCSILSAIRALALGVMKAFLFFVPGVDFCIVSCIFGKIFFCVKHLIDSLVHVF